MVARIGLHCRRRQVDSDVDLLGMIRISQTLDHHRTIIFNPDGIQSYTGLEERMESSALGKQSVRIELTISMMPSSHRR